MLRLHPELREDNYEKKNVMEITFLTGKIILHVPLHPFQGAKVDSGQKLHQINNKRKPALKVLFLFLHVKSKF